MQRNTRDGFGLFETSIRIVQLSLAPSSIAGLFANLAHEDRGALLLRYLTALLLGYLATLLPGNVLALLLRDLRIFEGLDAEIKVYHTSS